MEFVLDGEVIVPADVEDLAGYRRWIREADLEGRRIHWLGGRIEVEMSPEDLFTHNQVKKAITVALEVEALSRDLGLWFADGATLVNPAADLSNEPDGLLVCWETIDTGDARPVYYTSASGRTKCVEIEGRGDVVVEVVSDSSTKKDLVLLPVRYAQAAVPEYWIADAREELTFRLLRLDETGSYQDTPPDADGCFLSAVLGRRVRLIRQDRRGFPQYRLEVST